MTLTPPTTLPDTPFAPPTVPPAEDVLLLSAATPADLLDQLAGGPRAVPARPVDGTSVGHGPRLAIVDPTPKRLALARKVVTAGRPWRGRNDVWFSPEPMLRAGGRTAFLYPGLEAEFDPRVDDVAALLGEPVPDLSWDGVGRHGAAVIAVGRLLDRALRRIGVTPDAVAGHSVGEWTAMLAAGLYDPADFDAMLARTDLDAMLVPGVEFAVLGCPVERATQEIAAHPDVVVSHENSTHQTVVCGPADQIGALVDRMRAQAVICQLLPFRSGFHTPMLAPYLPPFLESGVPSLPVRTAATPVWSATTASPFPHDPAAVRDLAVRHLLEPVRFRALALALHDSGIRVFVQVGPGQLGSLVADTLRDRDHLVVAAGSTTRPGIAQLRRVAAALWAEGGAPDLTALEPRQVEPDPVSGLGPVERLRELATRTAWAGELAALLGEVADTVTDVVRAAAPVPDPVLEVSTRAMPHLLDHCFAWQRADWPDETDRRPVMPGATVLHHLVRAAEDAHPRRRAHTVTDIRLHRWLVAAPPARVPLVARPEGAGVRVALGDYADAVVHLTGDTPAREPVWGAQPGERRPALTAQQLYRERWMFHGPAYRGITRSVAISARGIRGQITVPPAPGALLDNVGQLIGQWLVETCPDRWIALPARIDRVVFHGPPPAPGQTVDCAIRITALAQHTVVADAQVSVGDRLLVSVTGWQDRRFDSDPRTSALHRFPETSTLAVEQDGGWWLLAERWDSLASREFYLRKYLNSVERAEHDACPPTERRRWLLIRIAVKDAVRGWLWRHGTGPVFPAEVLVRADRSGRITATGRHGLAFPPLSVAVEVCQELAAAAVGPADEPVGIGLVEVPGSAFGQLPELSEMDAGLLDRWRTATGDALPTALARLHAVHRAAPDERAVDAAAEDPGALVTASGARIRTDLLTSPQGLPSRRYAVAWRIGRTPALTAAHREDTP